MKDNIYSLGIEKLVDHYFDYAFQLKSEYKLKKGSIIQSIDNFFYIKDDSIDYGNYYRSVLGTINISASKNTNSDFNTNLINECFRPGTRLEIIENHRIIDHNDLADFEKNYILPYTKKIDRLRKLKRIIEDE